MNKRDLGCVGAFLLAASALACASFGPALFDSDAAYKQYVAGLQLSGVTAQAASARATQEGFACQTVGNVISGAPNELVVLCRRQAARSCRQDQSIVLRLDWVGTPRPALAPGMRVRDVGTALGPKVCE